MAKVNLLQETIEKLEEYSKSIEDVLWVGSKDGKYAIDWKDFALIADNEYDRDYNKQYVAKDLVVMGSDWWLERREYQGAEWWSYLKIPAKKDSLAFSTVFARGNQGWLTLEQIVTKDENGLLTENHANTDDNEANEATGNL